MKYLIICAALLQGSLCLYGQENDDSPGPVGMFSAGSRNTVSMFNDDNAIGKGIGAQFRLRLGRKLNSEWYLDYIASKNGELTYRNDYHIGWSLMFYVGNNHIDDRLIQPYLIAGHCFDKSVVGQQGNKDNKADRISMATQAGLGTHINITPRFDCSLSGQYMLHFGKEIKVKEEGDELIIQRENFTHADGHLLITLSFNYKLFHIWHGR